VHELAGRVPLLTGLVMAVVVVGLAGRVWGLARGRSPGPVPLWGFAALPLLGWAWQEAAERVLEVESFPFAATREPAFLKGLGVQVLFGIVALLWRGGSLPWSAAMTSVARRPAADLLSLCLLFGFGPVPTAIRACARAWRLRPPPEHNLRFIQG
jgi:hypothetical protein